MNTIHLLSCRRSSPSPTQARAALEEVAAKPGEVVGRVRLTAAFRFVVVGAPSYLEKHGTPQRPEDLRHHECLTFRSDSTGSLYAWEFERGRKTWRIPVRGSVVTNDGLFCIKWAEQGLGLLPLLSKSSAANKAFLAA